MTEYFKNEPKGIVVSMDTESGSNSYSVWFPYTKHYIKEIKVGSFVAVKNYDSEIGKNVYSVLEIISAFPRHYALGENSEIEKAFPGFVVEAAKNAKNDWEQEEPIEQTTKIKAEAISTGMQIIVNGKEELNLSVDDSLPMVGEEAHLLVDDVINKLVNGELLSEEISTISPSNLILNPNVKVKISTEDLLRTHFGVFGFTGAGKSNLVTNLITDILNYNNKVVVFDLMSEYTGLLSHLLYEFENSFILCDSLDSIPGSNKVIDYMSGEEAYLDEAVNSIINSLLLPKELIEYKDKYRLLFRKVLIDKKIKVFKESASEMTSDRFKEELLACITGNPGSNRLHLKKIPELFFGGEEVIKILKKEEYRKFIDSIHYCISNDKLIDTIKPSKKSIGLLPNNSSSIPQYEYCNLTSTGKGILGEMWNIAKKQYQLLTTEKVKIREEYEISMKELYNNLSSKSPSLMIVQSSNDDNLREFSSRLINSIFKKRKFEGLISPTILFMFDEADEFIPGQKIGDNSSYGLSSQASTLLARRGRKFGMGLGIATQRVAYLNTSILAQPHTFFVSKLPRKYDRDAITSAFGTSSEMLDKTLNFKKGQWMLFSYDATGLTNVPIPVQFPNANDKIKEFLDNLNENSP